MRKEYEVIESFEVPVGVVRLNETGGILDIELVDDSWENETMLRIPAEFVDKEKYVNFLMCIHKAETLYVTKKHVPDCKSSIDVLNIKRGWRHSSDKYIDVDELEFHDVSELVDVSVSGIKNDTQDSTSAFESQSALDWMYEECNCPVEIKYLDVDEKSQWDEDYDYQIEEKGCVEIKASFDIPTISYDLGKVSLNLEYVDVIKLLNTKIK